VIRPLTIAAIRPVSIALLAIGFLAACGSGPTVAVLEQRPAGKNNEVLSWQASASEGGAAHLVRVSIDTDPAKLMGWSRKDVGYRALLDVSARGPAGELLKKTVVVPITETHEIGQDGNTIQVAYDAAGTMMDTGFRRGTALDALRFKPTPGDWELSVRVRVISGGNRRALTAIRSVRVELLSRGEGSKALASWTELPPKIEGF